MVLLIRENWVDVQAKHCKYIVDRIKKSDSIISSKTLRMFVRRYAYQIAIGSPKQLRMLIIKANLLTKKLSKPNADIFFKEARIVFDYKLFSNIDRSKAWNAYTLTLGSKYKICPYCNQAYAFTVIAKYKSFRPTLDHYFSQKAYPYLALSLNNLIPSCYTCNSNLKNQKDFVKLPHLNPLADNEKIGFSFTDEGGAAKFITAISSWDTKNFTLVAEANGDTKAQNSINTFLLNSRFKLNTPELIKFVEITRLLTFDRLKELNTILHGNIQLETVLQFDLADYQNQMLGKIKKDLFKQFNSELYAKVVRDAT